jgi:hypothetical protein
MRHAIDYMKVHCKVGDKVPVYPFSWLGEPFVGIVEKVTMNKFGRISYTIGNREVFAEELLPAVGQTKLKMRVCT